MKLNDWLKATNGRITTGEECNSLAYNHDQYTLTTLSHPTSETSFPQNTMIVYDTRTYDVYEAKVIDRMYGEEKPYAWINPDYIGTKEDLEFSYTDATILDTEEDFLEKTTAIMSGEDYDRRVVLPLNLPDDQLFELMKKAHEEDITLNRLIERALIAAINEHKNPATEPSDWPFALRWERTDPDFDRVWDTIQHTPHNTMLVSRHIDGNSIEVSYTTQDYTYVVTWVDKLRYHRLDKPDLITRETKE